ncbi:MAG TPA: YtxH domain-containing protein [Candidatus Limnocylindria bacterium]|nr:YtxH domain-containing protein [Candidatus Limnocylindria bacterium]
MKDLQDVVDELKGQATKRASDLLGESKSEVRRAVGGHSDAALMGTLALGLVLGAIVGAAIALLFAPFTGDEARRRIGESVEKVRATEGAAGNGATRPVSAVGNPPYVSS